MPSTTKFYERANAHVVNPMNAAEFVRADEDLQVSLYWELIDLIQCVINAASADAPSILINRLRQMNAATVADVWSSIAIDWPILKTPAIRKIFRSYLLCERNAYSRLVNVYKRDDDGLQRKTNRKRILTDNPTPVRPPALAYERWLKAGVTPGVITVLRQTTTIKIMNDWGDGRIVHTSQDADGNPILPKIDQDTEITVMLFGPPDRDRTIVVIDGIVKEMSALRSRYGVYQKFVRTEKSGIVAVPFKIHDAPKWAEFYRRYIMAGSVNIRKELDELCTALVAGKNIAIITHDSTLHGQTLAQILNERIHGLRLAPAPRSTGTDGACGATWDDQEWIDTEPSIQGQMPQGMLRINCPGYSTDVRTDMPSDAEALARRLANHAANHNLPLGWMPHPNHIPRLVIGGATVKLRWQDFYRWLPDGRIVYMVRDHGDHGTGHDGHIYRKAQLRHMFSQFREESFPDPDTGEEFTATIKVEAPLIPTSLLNEFVPLVAAYWASVREEQRQFQHHTSKLGNTYADDDISSRFDRHDDLLLNRTPDEEIRQQLALANGGDDAYGWLESESVCTEIMPETAAMLSRHAGATSVQSRHELQDFDRIMARLDRRAKEEMVSGIEAKRMIVKDALENGVPMAALAARYWPTTRPIKRFYPKSGVGTIADGFMQFMGELPCIVYRKGHVMTLAEQFEYNNGRCVDLNIMNAPAKTTVSQWDPADRIRDRTDRTVVAIGRSIEAALSA